MRSSGLLMSFTSVRRPGRSLTARFSFAGFLPVMKTLLPALRKRSARPRPIPSLPPVIRTFAFERSSEFVDIIRILAFSTRQFAGGFVRAWPEWLRLCTASASTREACFPQEPANTLRAQRPQGVPRDSAGQRSQGGDCEDPGVQGDGALLRQGRERRALSSSKLLVLLSRGIVPLFSRKSRAASCKRGAVS